MWFTHMPTIRVTKAIVFQFTVTDPSGQVDTTTPATPGSSNPAALRVVINPNNPREAAAVAVSLTGVNPNNPVVIATVTAFGHTAQQGFTLAPAPDQSAVTIDTIGAEQDPPSWAV